ncbi:Transcriptional regulator TetR family [Paramagnetospirillum magnetotacticum MS-1]|uniref:Transcriptional regulator TetR family n=1 Tax=Paramagnetospirillum magnetotacticum MS-1 TaxID=272627 RepID=A0A0C2YTB6_PARME|nr:TetR/AcrR family transcriptional regulator [Paramagnetospirillum magnetotacticum]KIL98398.1 Transcriptional regulator TetR family [Paramagnetospirillum magnetotacticum MS-1]
MDTYAAGSAPAFNREVSRSAPAEKIRRRLPRREREKLIVTEAIRFFAEVGFEGQTRALADRLGVTQPLLYRYFPDKEALIERVYKEVFLNSWEPAWLATLHDRSRPLLDRVTEFYLAYTRANFSYERVRLFMFAGLKDGSIASRYMQYVRDQLFEPLCLEMRAELGLDIVAPVSLEEIEMVAGLHGAISYVGVRRWVYHAQTPADLEPVFIELVRTYLAGFADSYRRLAQARH